MLKTYKNFEEYLEDHINQTCENIPEGYKVVIFRDQDGNFSSKLVKKEEE